MLIMLREPLIRTKQSPPVNAFDDWHKGATMHCSACLYHLHDPLPLHLPPNPLLPPPPLPLPCALTLV